LFTLLYFDNMFAASWRLTC